MQAPVKAKGKPKREKEDYYTPSIVWQWLLKNMKGIYGKDFCITRLIDPCCGDNRMVDLFRQEYPELGIITNDKDTTTQAMFHLDSAEKEFWENVPEDKYNLVVTNPPFSQAASILYHALGKSERAVILTRITFLEGASYRLEFLQHIQKRLSVVVLPRLSFTDDGKTDSATSILLIVNAQNRFIKILGKEDLKC
jgi:type I restriction-modification system DNA methylase subunit